MDANNNYYISFESNHRIMMHTEVEGKGLERTVLVEFPSYDTAYACYNSDEYQQALDFTKNSSTRFFSIVEGI